MNEYKIIIGGRICITPPLRDEEEARAYAIGWYVGKVNSTHPNANNQCTSVHLLKRGVVPHDLSSGTSEA